MCRSVEYHALSFRITQDPGAIITGMPRVLEGNYFVGLGAQPRYVGRRCPRPLNDTKALLCRPTGDRATLSDVDGNLMLAQLPD
jgi:hypothetical protein